MFCSVLILVFLSFLTKCFFGQSLNGSDIVNDATVSRQLWSRGGQYSIGFGSCKLVMNPQCPDPDVTFFIYSKEHPENPQQVFAAQKLRDTNLHTTAFNPKKPTKIIIHGYNSNMQLNALTQLRKEYLKTRDYNVFAVDWSPLNKGPCYPGAVWNTAHVGACSAQLVQRLRDLGARDIHVIGFSLGAHITNFMAVSLRPYVLPRITGLDPALPLFTTTNLDQKLDATDAKFVDVYHTNAFMQGVFEESGHVDFYFNGGSVQPGCSGSSFFFCNHHRAPEYFAESINSATGFWGWTCPSYTEYLFGMCPPNHIQELLGEHVGKHLKGVYLVLTAADTPYAIGKYNLSISMFDLKSQAEQNRKKILEKYRKNIMGYAGLDENQLYQKLLNKQTENQNTLLEMEEDFSNSLFSPSNDYQDDIDYFR